MTKKTVLWWGRSDVNYSRNRIVRGIMNDWGWDIIDFSPSISVLGDIQASLKSLPKPELVWIPCFRQRDFYAARRYARRLAVPIVFDPLISSYDKQVFENRKLAEGSSKAEKLRRWERGMFQSADIILADTKEHARFFAEELGASRDKVFVVPVGAEEELFTPQRYKEPNNPVEVLFYGSFVPLQGVDIIVEAARLVPEVNWALLGKGKLRDSCEKAAEGLKNVRFEDWVPYDRLAERIGQADILLGIFGSTPKAARVIPNKLYQAIACGRSIITLDSAVYTEEMKKVNKGGISWVLAGDAQALADEVKRRSLTPEGFSEDNKNARKIFDNFYSTASITSSLIKALSCKN